MFTFQKDRSPQGATFGPGGSRCIADQTKFRSIWGVVDGPLRGPWTAHMIQNGEIRSADGKASLGGTEVLTNGKPHIVSDGDTKYQEFQVPIADVEQWNKYEAIQGNEQVRAFQGKEESKRSSHGRDPFLKIDSLDVQMAPPQFDTSPEASPSAAKPTKARTPAQLANDERLRAKSAAKRAALSTANS